MTPATAFLSALEYPGRLILVGAAPGREIIVAYGITGRSASSQARKLVSDDRGIWVRPTDEETLKKGNVGLLVYPALLFGERGLAVSNGNQTGDILGGLASAPDPVAVLSGALAAWDYEPDSPIFTPRISGCVAAGRAGLSLIRRGPEGLTLRSYFEVLLRPGTGRFVSTYQGPNRDPLPSFEGEPPGLELGWDSARETAEGIYEALGPRASGKDFRVAVVSVFVDPADVRRRDVRIINRQERT
jgi:IMP cyclohydrolase